MGVRVMPPARPHSEPHGEKPQLCTHAVLPHVTKVVCVAWGICSHKPRSPTTELLNIVDALSSGSSESLRTGSPAFPPARSGPSGASQPEDQLPPNSRSRKWQVAVFPSCFLSSGIKTLDFGGMFSITSC